MKKILSLLVALVAVIGVTLPGTSATFSDVETSAGNQICMDCDFEQGCVPVCVDCPIEDEFNCSPICQNKTIWFSSVFQVLEGAPATDFTINFQNSEITFSANSQDYTLPVPDASITFSTSATQATTSFNTGTNTWETTVPHDLAGNIFLDGLAFIVPAGGLPGNIDPVGWSGCFTSDAPGLTVKWKWAAAVYKTFNTDYNALGVKPCDAKFYPGYPSFASEYPYSDKAGTPENYKSYTNVVPGATGYGTGEYKYTGAYSDWKVCPVGSCQQGGCPPPEVTVICPNGGEQWQIYDKVKIKWEVSDFPVTIDIDFSNNSGTSYDYHIVTLQPGDLGSGSYDYSPDGYYYYWWDIPYDPYLLGHHSRIKITATNECGSGFDVSDQDFCPDLPPEPEVEVISPDDGQCETGENFRVRWQTEGLGPEHMSIDGFLSEDDGRSWIEIFGDEKNDGACNWQVPTQFSDGDRAKLRIVARYPFDVYGEGESEFQFVTGAEVDESASLVITESSAELTADGETACNISLQNGGEAEISIDRLVIGWAGEESRTAELHFGDGGQSQMTITSGEEWDISDITLSPGVEDSLDLILSGGQPGETIEIDFVMRDGTVITISLDVPPEETQEGDG